MQTDAGADVGAFVRSGEAAQGQRVAVAAVAATVENLIMGTPRGLRPL